MKVGMNLMLWTVRPSASAHAPLLQQIKAWGFHGAEFPLGGMSDRDAVELARVCDTIGLERTATFSFAAAEADPASPEPALRSAAVEKINRALERARQLGSGILNGPLFQGLGRFTGSGPTADEWRWAVDTLRSAAEFAATLQMRLALEPLNRFEMYMVNTIADGARFCDDIGLANVGLLADTHHSNIEEEQPAEIWARYIDRIFHVHISENHRGIPGHGHAAGPEIFTALRRGGYASWLVIEAFGLDVQAIRPRLHVWRPFFERLEDVPELGLRFIEQSWHIAGR